MKNGLNILSLSLLLSCNTKVTKDDTIMDGIEENTSYEISRYIPEPREKVYSTFIDADGLKKIWGLTSITLDPRPEGKSFAKMQIGNEKIDFTLTFKEMVQNERLSWIVQFDSLTDKEIHTTIWFRNAKGGTDLIFRQENFTNPLERDENKKEWEYALMRLEGLISWK